LPLFPSSILFALEIRGQAADALFGPAAFDREHSIEEHLYPFGLPAAKVTLADFGTQQSVLPGVTKSFGGSFMRFYLGHN
jgi:hypothetical protein